MVKDQHVHYIVPDSFCTTLIVVARARNIKINNAIAYVKENGYPDISRGSYHYTFGRVPLNKKALLRAKGILQLLSKYLNWPEKDCMNAYVIWMAKRLEADATKRLRNYQELLANG